MISRRWCFTLNNYTEVELESLRLSLQTKARYAIIGKERGKEGTLHLQGYVSLHSNARLKGIKKILGDRAHAEVAKGNETENYQYCSKDGDFEEIGTRACPGKRTDLDDFCDYVTAGHYDIPDLRENFREVFAKYPRFCTDYVRDKIPAPEVPSHPLRDWQQDLYANLSLAPDDRKVIFIVDRVGNKGKSWFAKYYCSLHSNAFLMKPGKHADMAYVLPHILRVLFLDCTRKQVEHLPYSLIESLKDGYVMSAKYESCMKKYPPMHVVVLLNEDPDLNALSQDRYIIVNLDK